MKKRDLLVEHLKSFFMENTNKGYGIEMVFLYGSWARGIPRDESDIDIAILFSDDLHSEKVAFEHIVDISYRLTEELKKEVNVIQIHPDFRKPMLYYNAIILGKPVFIKNRERYARIITEAIYQMEDFSIFGLNWQYEVAKKNLEGIGNA
jgi:predicted nucleotidyltransferase